MANYCFACMESIEDEPIKVWVKSDFCHSSYWGDNKDEKSYGTLEPDGVHGYLFLHSKCDASDQSSAFGEGFEYCSTCGVLFNEDDLNMPDYEITDEIHCPDCQSAEGSFLTIKDFPLNPDGKIDAHVFSDSDVSDAVALKAGFEFDKSYSIIDTQSLSVGFDNSSLNFGWIATMSDGRNHNIQDMITLLNWKVEEISQTKNLIVGFYQTGHFSVGYTIYTK